LHQVTSMQVARYPNSISHFANFTTFTFHKSFILTHSYIALVIHPDKHRPL